ncbi:ABC transporter A family member 10-like [Prunus dulcis]|uniref:ABC transporter A family member 10-like n=1 Tax=Prunus dulcis TaxID=3755 RepID=UPI001482450B|nr:ABC transporter A family member 10-like [Prunus dulcis]
MADRSCRPASFWTQSNALLRKNFTFQMPAPRYRAVRSDFVPFTDLPNESCRKTESCPVTILVTGNNQSFGETVAGNLFLNSISLDSTSIMDNFSNNVMGTESKIGESKFSDPAFMFDHIYDQASAYVSKE